MHVDVEAVEACYIWRAVGDDQVDEVGGIGGCESRVDGFEKQGDGGRMGDVGFELDDAFQGCHGLEIDGDDFDVGAGFQVGFSNVKVELFCRGIICFRIPMFAASIEALHPLTPGPAAPNFLL